MKKILISGSLAYDRIMDFPGFFSEHLLPEKLHSLSISFTVDTLEQSFGGTAGNIAYNLALLQEQPEILASVGKDFGIYEEWLKTCRIETASIQKEAEIGTASAHIITDKADNQIAAFYPGALTRPYAKEIDFAGTALAIVAPGNTSDMSELPKKFRRAGLRFLFDPGQQIIALNKEQLQEGIEGSAAVLANDYESEIIAQRTGWDRTEILNHTEMLVVTLGAEGSTIYTKEREYKIGAAKVKNVVDPTGAGDAYRAGFIKGVLLGLPVQIVGQLASIAASYAVEARGTQGHFLTIENLKSRYEDTFKEPLAI
jgi:adenosine kinase